jgi:hypothetical protein
MQNKGSVSLIHTGALARWSQTSEWGGNRLNGFRADGER